MGLAGLYRAKFSVVRRAVPERAILRGSDPSEVQLHQRVALQTRAGDGPDEPHHIHHHHRRRIHCQVSCNYVTLQIRF